MMNISKPRSISPSKSKTTSAYITTMTDIEDRVVINSLKTHRPDRISYNNELLATQTNKVKQHQHQHHTTERERGRERGHIHDSEMKYNGYDGYGMTPTPQTGITSYHHQKYVVMVIQQI